jgi:hypothetical protein
MRRSGAAVGGIKGVEMFLKDSWGLFWMGPTLAKKASCTRLPTNFWHCEGIVHRDQAHNISEYMFIPLPKDVAPFAGRFVGELNNWAAQSPYTVAGLGVIFAGSHSLCAFERSNAASTLSDCVFYAVPHS